MEFNSRGYQDQSDLSAIGSLIRQAYQMDPYWNSWSFALYDIWSQRKLGDQEVFGMTEWQHDMRLWQDRNKDLYSESDPQPHFQFGRDHFSQVEDHTQIDQKIEQDAYQDQNTAGDTVRFKLVILFSTHDH